MRGLGAVVLSVCTLGLAGGVASASGGEARPLSPQELVVRFQPGAAQKRALEAVGATLVERAPVSGLVRARLEPGRSSAEVEAALERRGDVAYAEPNRMYELFRVPDDTRYSELWGLPAIGAPTAWDMTTGSDSVVVAVVDSGTDYTHPELDGNIWTNPNETLDGADNDGNGLVDDLRGWDFYANPNDAAPLDGHGHGTHVAGTIGAEGNNTSGVTGVNWRVKVMPLRVGDEQLSGFAIVQAFGYACAKGARVVNGSFGSSESFTPIRDAIAACPNTLFVFAAGNSARNADAFPTYPCAEPVSNVICVAASQLGDTLASFSNFGAVNVDLAAPGANILSTLPPALDLNDDAADGYASWNGTSMAAPHVAGAAALVLAQRPTLTTAELKNALLLSVDTKPSFAGVVATGGRLNVARALGQEVVPPTGLTATSPSHPGGVWSNRQAVDLSWGGATDANGIDGYSFAFSPVPGFAPDEVKDVEETTTSLTMTLSDGDHWFHVRARDGSGNWGSAVHVGPIRIDSFQPVRPVPSSPSHRVGGASADRTIDAAWNGAADSASGLDGFSVSWSQGRAAAADDTKDVEEDVMRVTSPRLAVGAWWFNIRARDNAGNWSDTVSIGPFSIRGGPTACAVPRLRGLTLVGAKRLLAKRGCSLGRVTRARSRRVRRGRVLAQRPSPGLRLRRGARVAVVLSRGRR
jgi:subtilisin family serine protease